MDESQESKFLESIRKKEKYWRVYGKRKSKDELMVLN